MHVEHIELVMLGYFGHAGRQRRRVRRVLEQRIGRNFHFVVIHTRRIGVQANGIGVRNEVHVMASVGEFQAKLCGDDAASAVRRVTGNANPHAPPS